MARTGAVIAGLEKVGIRDTRSDRLMRYERDAGLIPMGAQGAKSPVGHLECPHLKNVLLGFAGDQPSDAAEAAIKLTALEFYEVNEGTTPLLSGSLGDVLEHIIQQVAEQAIQQKADASDSSAFCLPDLILSVNPLWAEVHWPRVDRKAVRVEIYKPGVGKFYVTTPWVVSKQTRIGGEMLVAMGELLADTIQQQRDVPENTKAAGAPPPNGLRAKSKQAAKPVPVDEGQLTHSPKSGQSRQVRGLPSSPLVER